MTPVILKFKEKNSFLSLSSLDEEELSKTWRVCTKVKDSLENGSRLENLSWRLWFLQNINDTKSKDTSKEENQDQQQETPESVLNYSLNDIKPNSFILNQFTSDQEGEQTIELKDIFPIEMQDYMYPVPENDPVYSPSVDNNLFINTNSQLYVYNNSSSHLTNHSTNLDSYITNVPQSLTNQYAEEMAHLFGTNLMESSIIPSMTIPIDRYTDYYSTIPNATLHNKMLATLPKQTLASAEKILSPTLAQRQQQHDSDSYQTMTSTFNTVQPAKKKPSSAALATPVSLTEEKPTICSNCEATSTPLWRRSDDKILCNACGLYLKLHNMPRPKHLKLLQGKSNKDVMDETTSSKTDEKSDIKHQTICSNCGTSKTPLWRRDIEGAPLCNACGLYLKLHNEKRPLSMKTDVIKKRQRTETLLAATTSEQLKKPKYFDHLALYSRGKANNSSVGYKSFGTSLPGTGILMMTTTAGSNGR